MELGVMEEKFSLIYNNLLDFKVKNFEVRWDGYGGLEFEFTPQISDFEIKNNLTSTLSEIIEEADFSWNLNIEIVSLDDAEILLEFTEQRNLSQIGDITFENSDFLSADLYNYILINHGLNIDECECIVNYSQTGYSIGDTKSDCYFSSEGSYASEGNFSFVVFKDEEYIDVTCEELEKIVGMIVHNYIVDNCSMHLSYFDYNFEFMDGELNDISLLLNPVILTLKKLYQTTVY